MRPGDGPPPARRTLAAALALAALAAAWGALYSDVPGLHLAVLCTVGAAPAVAAAASRRGYALAGVAALAAVPLTLALALRASPFGLVTLDGDAWGAARDILPAGARASEDAVHPVSAVEEPALVALLDCALAALAATAAWQIVVRRRPLVGILVVAAGLAYPWTVAPPGAPVAAGALALGLLLVSLALAAPGGRRPLAGLGAAGAIAALAVALATAAGTGSAGAAQGWWDWKEWSLRGGGASGVSALDLRQGYGTLDWPREPRVALRVVSERRLPLRAAALDEFDGSAFTIGEEALLPRPLPVAGGAIAVSSDAAGPLVRQTVTLVGARAQALLAPGRPVLFSGPFTGAAALVGDGVWVDPALGPGASYAVQGRVAQASPRELVEAGGYEAADVPAGQTVIRPDALMPAVEVPPFGRLGAEPADAALGPYAGVRRLAREVAGDADTPYAALNRIESFLRSEYVYDEKPSRPPEGSPPRPPLVRFLLDTRTGFCQHFAGSMALMLRTIGIPARVAVGYTGGRYDPETREWVVVDRDAHSWVEAWLPGHGWLPFDPTPGRSAPNPASVSSPDYVPVPAGAGAAGLLAPVTRTLSPIPDAPASARQGGEGGGGVLGLPSLPDAGGRGWMAALAALALLVAGPPLGKAARRGRRRRRGDERRRVLAALRELEAELLDLGLAPSRAASGAERATVLNAALGVDASGLYRRAAEARFAPGAPAPGAGAAAWTELRGLRRALRAEVPVWRRAAAAWRPRSLLHGTVRR